MGARDVTDDDLGQLWMDLHHKLHRVVFDTMNCAGVSPARFKVLMKLAEFGPMNQAAIANSLGFAPRSVTETVDALERDGLVTRTEDAHDRRARIVALTDAGRTAHESGAVVRSKAMHQIFGSLSAAQRTTLSDLLDTIRTNLPTGECS